VTELLHPPPGPPKVSDFSLDFRSYLSSSKVLFLSAVAHVNLCCVFFCSFISIGIHGQSSGLPFGSLRPTPPLSPSPAATHAWLLTTEKIICVVASVAATIDIDCWSFYPAPALPSAASVAGAARPFL
jgi:hypothetical protein